MGVEMVWFWRRVTMLARPPSLLEKMLLSLGAALTFLNLPIEYFTLAYNMPWINLFNDIKQGVFYANLLQLLHKGRQVLLAHSGDVGKLSHLLLDRVWHDHDDLLGFEEVVGEEW